MVQKPFNSKNVGGRYGSGHQDGGCREWSSWKIKYDSEILQRHFYKRLQENHWSWFFGATNPVCIWPFYLLGFDLWIVSKTFARMIVTNYSTVQGEASRGRGSWNSWLWFSVTHAVHIFIFLYFPTFIFSLPLLCSFPIPLGLPFHFILYLFCIYWWHFKHFLNTNWYVTLVRFHALFHLKGKLLVYQNTSHFLYYGILLFRMSLLFLKLGKTI